MSSLGGLWDLKSLRLSPWSGILTLYRLTEWTAKCATTVLIQIVHALILREVLELATYCLVLADVQLAVDVVAVDREHD